MPQRRDQFQYEDLLACARGELFGEGNAKLLARHYGTIESFREYLIVHQDRRHYDGAGERSGQDLG